MEEITESRRRDYLEKIRKLRLMDDDFFTWCMEGSKECVELILRIIMDKDDLEVLSAQTQYTIKNLQGRSVRLDVLATDQSGRQFNIEVQREGRGAAPKRVRYHSSVLDSNFLLAGDEFEKLPETYIIFIAETDIYKKGLPLYNVERHIAETNEAFNDEAHIMYVNGEYKGETPLGRLMHDFSCTDPEDMKYQILAERTGFFKNDEEGVGIMCKLLEDMRMEAIEEGKRECAANAARLMLKDGTLSVEKIAAFTGLTYDEVKTIAENR